MQNVDIALGAACRLQLVHALSSGDVLRNLLLLAVVPQATSMNGCEPQLGPCTITAEQLDDQVVPRRKYAILGAGAHTHFWAHLYFLLVWFAAPDEVDVDCRLVLCTPKVGRL